MTNSARVRVSAGFSAVIASLVLSSCSFGTPTVPKEDVEKKVSEELTAEVGQEPDEVSCPDDLKGEEGETMRCTLSAGGDEIGLTVKVTSVEDGNINFDIKVDDAVK